MTSLRQYSAVDQIVMGFDDLIKGLKSPSPQKFRPNPADFLGSESLTQDIRRHSASLMRVNHAGEVSAQALYYGQGITASDHKVKIIMRDAAREEVDHLVWCQQRLDELGSHSSCLNPVWYAGSFTLGALAGYMGDAWSLGFVAETEFQVMRHLDDHLERLSEEDLKSHAILRQMKIDEGKHATLAIESGARKLPEMVKKLMSLCSKVMTKIAYWI
jgi:3-demethoxyubiquinol 3-hydroxylase